MTLFSSIVLRGKIWLALKYKDVGKKTIYKVITVK